MKKAIKIVAVTIASVMLILKIAQLVQQIFEDMGGGLEDEDLYWVK